MVSFIDEQYNLIKSYLPVQRRNVQISNLDLINAVVYGAENRCTWRALPREFGNGHTRLYALEAMGGKERLLIGLQDQKLIKISAPCLGIDSTSIKGHPDAAGALKKWLPQPSTNRAANGRQGWTTKIHRVAAHGLD